MKKFISISALLIAITSGVFITLGSASVIRPSTNRVFAYNYRNHLRRKTPTVNKEMSKFVFWYNFQQQKTKTYNRHDYAAWRSAHDALFPRDNNLYSIKKNIVRHDDSLIVRTTRELPKPDRTGWQYPIPGIKFQLASDLFLNEDGRYEDKRSDLVFEVNKFTTECTSLGFQQCAITRAKSIRERRGLKAIRNVSREFSISRAMIGGKNMIVPRFQEIFTVNDYGVERTYVISTIQNPVTKEVVYVEGWSSVHDAPRAKNLLRGFARTIRFK